MKLIALLSLCFLLIAGCASQAPIGEQVLGGIQPGPSGQLFPPHNNLAMGGHLFTGSGAAVVANEPCVYGQTNCSLEVVNNLFAAANLPGGKAAGTQEVVTDWNGTAGVCVGGSSGLSLATFNGSAWICFGGSGGGGGGGPGQTQTTINGTGVTGGSGTLTCNEYWVTTNVKNAFCVGNAYYNPTGVSQTWQLPSTTASGIIPTFTANSTPFSTMALSGANIVISFPFNMGAAWSGIISTSEFY